MTLPLKDPPLETALTYDDVLLVPQYSNIRSRSDIDISTDLGKNLVLELPIIASPMDTISEAPMAIAMSKHGGVAILHRYSSLVEQHRMLTYAKDTAGGQPLTIGAAIGTTGDYLERASAMVASGVTFLCVDVAHGHSYYGWQRRDSRGC